MIVDDTARRFTVKIVLRGVDRGTRTQIDLEGFVFYFTGEPSAEAWAGVALRPGDLEAIAWTTRTDSSELAGKLRARPDVVAVDVI